MKAVLLRTGSFQVLPSSSSSSFVSGSPSVSFSVHDWAAGEKSCNTPPKFSLHLEVNDRSKMRKTQSESDVIRSESGSAGRFSRLSGQKSRGRILEEEYLSDGEEVLVGSSIGSLNLTAEQRNFAGSWPDSGIPMEELGFPDGGAGKGRSTSGGGGGSRGCESTYGDADGSKMRAYYLEMLKANPTNSLLLRNYAKFLHEVERDTEKAEEYYERAILASPGDGEVLSLYGKLIWETQRDESKAKSYFDRAVHASPADCMVLGSYAHFMWEAEDEEEENGVEEMKVPAAAASMVAAF